MTSCAGCGLLRLVRPLAPRLLCLLEACPGEPPADSDPPVQDTVQDSLPPVDTQDSAPVEEVLAPVSAMALRQHEQVATMLVLEWTQDSAVELTCAPRGRWTGSRATCWGT